MEQPILSLTEMQFYNRVWTIFCPSLLVFSDDMVTVRTIITENRKSQVNVQIIPSVTIMVYNWESRRCTGGTLCG